MVLCEFIGGVVLAILEGLLWLCDVVGEFTIDVSYLAYLYLLITVIAYKQFKLFFDTAKVDLLLTSSYHRG